MPRCRWVVLPGCYYLVLLFYRQRWRETHANFWLVEPLGLLVLLDRPDGDIVFLYKDKYICTFIPVTWKSKMKQNEKKLFGYQRRWSFRMYRRQRLWFGQCYSEWQTVKFSNWSLIFINHNIFYGIYPVFSVTVFLHCTFPYQDPEVTVTLWTQYLPFCWECATVFCFMLAVVLGGSATVKHCFVFFHFLAFTFLECTFMNITVWERSQQLKQKPLQLTGHRSPFMSFILSPKILNHLNHFFCYYETQELG